MPAVTSSIRRISATSCWRNPIRVRLSRRQLGVRRNLFFFTRRDEFRSFARPGSLFRSRNFPVPVDVREIAKRANKIVLNSQWDLPDSFAVPVAVRSIQSRQIDPTVSERVYFESPDESHLETDVPPAYVRRPR